MILVLAFPALFLIFSHKCQNKKCFLFGRLTFDNEKCNKAINSHRKIVKNRFFRDFKTSSFCDPEKTCFLSFYNHSRSLCCIFYYQTLADWIRNIFCFGTCVKKSKTTPENAKTSIKSNFFQSLKDFLGDSKMLLPREHEYSSQLNYLVKEILCFTDLKSKGFPSQENLKIPKLRKGV